MAVIYKCNRCGGISKTGKLHRILPFSVVTVDESDVWENRSKLDLCDDCVTRIMRDANTPIPQAAK
jgi:hypothetical protein